MGLKCRCALRGLKASSMNPLPLPQHQHQVRYRARRMYEKKHGKRPKNYFGESLFKVGCGEGLKWARAAAEAGDCELLAAFPRYHPWWAWWMVHVPGLREFAVSNLVLVLRKR